MKDSKSHLKLMKTQGVPLDLFDTNPPQKLTSINNVLSPYSLKIITGLILPQDKVTLALVLVL
tara:strand:+ start:151721 stop:151909 length:189 start_codon:yes stop_codon:yes gene_type:complete